MVGSLVADGLRGRCCARFPQEARPNWWFDMIFVRPTAVEECQMCGVPRRIRSGLGTRMGTSRAAEWV